MLAYVSVPASPEAHRPIDPTGSIFDAALDAPQSADRILRFHADDQSGNTLRVAVAAACKLNGSDDAFLYLYVDCVRTNAFGW